MSEKRSMKAGVHVCCEILSSHIVTHSNITAKIDKTTRNKLLFDRIKRNDTRNFFFHNCWVFVTNHILYHGLDIP